jgi:hypothetical protein
MIPSNLTDLPDTLVHRILTHVSLRDLLTLMEVNRRWYERAREDLIWKQQTYQMFGEVPRRGGSWQWTFRHYYQSSPVFELLVPLRGLTRPSSLSLFQCLCRSHVQYRTFSWNRDIRLYLTSADSYFLELQKMATHPAYEYLHRDDQIRVDRSSLFPRQRHSKSKRKSPADPPDSSLTDSSLTECQTSFNPPDEIKLQILEFLDVAAIGQVSRVNTEWARVCRDDRLWQDLVRRDLGSISFIPATVGMDDTSPAHQTYRQAYAKMRPVQLMIRLRGLTTPQSIDVLRCLWENRLTYIAPYQDPPQIFETDTVYSQELRRILNYCPTHPVITYLDLDDLTEASRIDAAMSDDDD